jgi:hypothetical protein
MYLVNSSYPKLGVEALNGGFGKLPIPTRYPPTNTVRERTPVEKTLDCPKCPECPVCDTCVECPDYPECPECEACAECQSCEEQGYKLASDAEGGVKWWWLLIAGAAGIGVGFGAAKVMTKK